MEGVGKASLQNSDGVHGEDRWAYIDAATYGSVEC